MTDDYLLSNPDVRKAIIELLRAKRRRENALNAADEEINLAERVVMLAIQQAVLEFNTLSSGLADVRRSAQDPQKRSNTGIQ